MSLTIDGVWAADVWDSTAWGECVWYEPGCAVPEVVEEVYSGGFFDFPDTPPKRKKKKKKKRVEEIIKVIAKKVALRPSIDQELALRLAIVDAEIVYNELYLELLHREVKKRKKRRKAIILLLTGDG